MPAPNRVEKKAVTYSTTPPEGDYSPAQALDDIPMLRHALELFLSSKMVESEQFCHECDPKNERLYFATGNGLIQCVKGLMSFEDENLVSALKDARHGNLIASQHRKRAASLPTRLAGLVVGSFNTSGMGWIKSMTAVERHAELVYAESLSEKAILGIVYSGDWLAFIKEALNMRTATNIYRQLAKYIETADAAAQARGEGPEDKSIDNHFRTGVYLGAGITNVYLSLMPARLLTIVEMFGYKADRHAGLALLQKAGGWTADSPDPSVSFENEGIRRPLCDLNLLIFHLFMSSVTFDGVDISMALKILDYYLKRFPNGFFFLFSQGRMYLCRSQPALAIESYRKAIAAQSQYRNMHHMSFWEIAIANLALWDISASLECWRPLVAEATWSKATYTYGVAVCLLQLGGDERRAEAVGLMDQVPKLRQRIAGKSIPLEKLVARKARKFIDQGNRLALPALELAYLFLAIAHAPRGVIVQHMIPQIEEAFAKLKVSPSDYEGGGYWDDMCLALFLKAVCLRHVAYPDVDAIIEPEEKLSISQEEAEKGSLKAFETLYTHSAKVALDHHLIYYAHYEHGRLLSCLQDKAGARQHLELVMSGKALEGLGVSRKGKYSMENALQVKVHAALEALDQNRRL